ncbi:MAG: SDR family NAD(P)-dependent oxidoreductase [Hyphomicrobiaceae bacterium]
MACTEGHGRAALITGAGQNIGRAIALRLAADGFDIAINGRFKKDQCDAVAAEIEGMGRKSVVAMGDIGTPDFAKRVANDAMVALGSIDVLVTNAAIRPHKPFLEIDAAEWHELLNVNFNSTFWLAQRCLPGMIERGWGRIINFAGMNAMNGYNGRAHVSASKHAAWGLTKSLAKEFCPKGITANIISPGPIRSEHDDPAMTAQINEQASKIPVGRLGEPSEVAAVVSMLAFDAGAFVNGGRIAERELSTASPTETPATKKARVRDPGFLLSNLSTRPLLRPEPRIQ